MNPLLCAILTAIILIIAGAPAGVTAMIGTAPVVTDELRDGLNAALIIFAFLLAVAVVAWGFKPRRGMHD